MEKSIIDSSEHGIVVKETSVYLSDEKLRSVLSRMYERAQKDASSSKLRKFYNVFLSIAGTLFLTLLTADFKSLGTVDAKIIEFVAWGICIGAAGFGFVLMGLTVSWKTRNDTSERDKAVKEVFEQHLLNG